MCWESVCFQSHVSAVLCLLLLDRSGGRAGGARDAGGARARGAACGDDDAKYRVLGECVFSIACQCSIVSAPPGQVWWS